MQFFQLLFLFFLFSIFQITNILASNNKPSSQYQLQCLKDLDFIKQHMVENSSPFKNREDKDFKNWFELGYVNTKDLIGHIRDSNDCYYAMKFYINGFAKSHISVRGYVPLPKERYPGLLTAKYGDHHVVIYKNKNISYLKDINIGDKVTHINDMSVDEYYNEYILPFYANEPSEFAKKAASVYMFVLDGNPYKPTPLTAVFFDNKTKTKLELKYTDLSHEPLLAIRNVSKPDINEGFKVKIISDGVWISIPSFYLNTEDTVFYTGMLSKLKELAKLDYIIFDMRGNKGGAAQWSRSIIRNLWGDDYIKSLGKEHDYNNTWVKKVRVSKLNFFDLKKTLTAGEIKNFAISLKNGDDYFEKKWKIYSEDLNLYSNKDNTPVKAKIYVLTDHFCKSTCWSFVNELLEIPSVIHLGLPTAIQSNYSYARKIKSPSENFDFFYPTEIKIYPNKHSEKALVPSKIFNGDMRDETALVNWVLSITESGE